MKKLYIVGRGREILLTTKQRRKATGLACRLATKAPNFHYAVYVASLTKIVTKGGSFA